jgi:hypothetical protein
MNVKQLDLFSFDQQECPAQLQAAPVLNGCYYETSSNRFVCFVLGRRHYEVSAVRCREPKDWQAKLKKERAI